MSDSLIQQNVELVNQGIRLLRDLPEGVYSPDSSNGSEAPAVGPHVRHCLDFYLCFLDGLDGRVVDYDSRQRRPEVERRRDTAVAELMKVTVRLERLSTPANERLELRPEAAAESAESELLESTVGRELQFLASHTVHHYALIALALRLSGHQVPGGFGVAPSTLEHWRREGRVVR